MAPTVLLEILLCVRLKIYHYLFEFNLKRYDSVSLLFQLVQQILNATKPVSPPIKGKSCSSLYKSGQRQDGIYSINPDGIGYFSVMCDMNTDGGGWTVFQRRRNASVDFYRGWQDYKNGFGDLNGNFWLGLEKIHVLTESGQNVLRVDLIDWTNDQAFAKYRSFSVASESDNYSLSYGNFSGKIL